VKWEKVNATLPKDLSPEAVTMEQALELIAAKAGAKGKKKAASRAKTAKTKAASGAKANTRSVAATKTASRRKASG
jgi:DNA topoisomerase I